MLKNGIGGLSGLRESATNSASDLLAADSRRFAAYVVPQGPRQPRASPVSHFDSSIIPFASAWPSVWQSLQPAICTRYLPRAASGDGSAAGAAAQARIDPAASAAESSWFKCMFPSPNAGRVDDSAPRELTRRAAGVRGRARPARAGTALRGPPPSPRFGQDRTATVDGRSARPACADNRPLPSRRYGETLGRAESRPLRAGRRPVARQGDPWHVE